MPKKATTKPVKKVAAKAVAKKTVKPAAKAAKTLKAPKAVKAAKAPKAPKPAKASKPVKTGKVGRPPKAATLAKVAPAKASKVGKTGPKRGRGRVTSPSGPLSTAVVSVLKRAKRPMSCREITDALVKKNYQFTHPEPKRIVSIRIYKLKGVKQTGPGRFAAAEE